MFFSLQLGGNADGILIQCYSLAPFFIAIFQDHHIVFPKGQYGRLGAVHQCAVDVELIIGNIGIDCQHTHFLLGFGQVVNRRFSCLYQHTVCAAFDVVPFDGDGMSAFFHSDFFHIAEGHRFFLIQCKGAVFDVLGIFHSNITVIFQYFHRPYHITDAADFQHITAFDILGADFLPIVVENGLFVIGKRAVFAL